jgi:hypothetical protein
MKSGISALAIRAPVSKPPETSSEKFTSNDGEKERHGKVSQMMV